MFEEKSLRWLKKSIKQDYKMIKVLQSRYAAVSEESVQLFDEFMHLLVDQVKRKEFELDVRRGRV